MKEPFFKLFCSLTVVEPFQLRLQFENELSKVFFCHILVDLRKDVCLLDPILFAMVLLEPW